MILDEILESKRDELVRIKPFAAAFEASAAQAEAPRGFEAALRAPGEVAVIAEFKRRSPSEGEINPYADVGGVARCYEQAGARAVSVLTDGPFFGGSLDDLRRARDACGLPLLRKDFILEPIQLYESRAAGADAVLLIVRALTDARLRELLAEADELGLAALVEAHDEAEVERALDAGARIVGVNARDLRTFEVDLDASLALIETLPAGVVAVAESGVRGGEDVERAGSAGADAVLVGGWLMKRDPLSGVEELVGHRRRPRSGALEGAAAPAGADPADLDEPDEEEPSWSG